MTEFIGSGSYRDVYLHPTDPTRVVKSVYEHDLMFSDDCNLAEYKVYQEFKHVQPQIGFDGASYTLRLAKAYDYNPEDFTLVMEFVDHGNLEDYVGPGDRDFNYCSFHDFYDTGLSRPEPHKCIYCTLHEAMVHFYKVHDLSGENVKYNPADSEFIVIDYSH